MPRSVIILSDDPQLFGSVASILGSDARFKLVGHNLNCDGSGAPLTNIYPVENLAADWEDWDEAESGVLNPARMSALIFETLSPEWVAEVGLLLATALEAPAWFVDSAGTAWPVGAADPSRIALT